MENLNLFIRSIFIDNMIFAYFLGMCSYLAVSKNVKTAMGLGVAVTFVLVITLPVNYLLENYILKAGALSWLGDSFEEVDLSFLSLIFFIAVVAAMVQLVEMIVEKYAPALYNTLGIFLPLIAVNCAILGGSLFMQQRAFPDAWSATVYGLGSGIGYRRHCRHTGKNGLFQCARTPQRHRYNFYRNGAYGDCLHEFPRYQTVNTLLL